MTPRGFGLAAPHLRVSWKVALMGRVGGGVAQLRARAVNLVPPKIGKQDALAAVTTGIANIPDGMASAVLAGVNPVYGIYTLIFGTPIAALTISTQLMVVNTTSAMTLVAVDALGSRQGDNRAAALFTIALVAGIFQLALGLLGFGMLTKFVSNAVMTGFLTGIATMIILGQLWSLTGYEGEGGTRIEQTAQLLANLRDVDPVTTGIGVGSLVLMFLLARTKLGSYNLLIVLALATAVARIGNFESLELVNSLGEIPQSLPSLNIPRLALIPDMLLAGIAVGAVGLLQAAGVAQAYPNRDGSDNDDSRDFVGQGIANIACSFMRGMACGGSLSSTALNVSAGAQTRWAMVIQAVVVLIVVSIFGGVLSLIPMAGLAALLIYSSVLAIKPSAIAMVLRTSWVSFAGMAVTFFATLVIPLQQAVMVGIALASVLFLYRASIDVRVRQMRVDAGRLIVSDPPPVLPSNAVTVLDVEGNLFYAGARTLGNLLPDPKQTQHAAVVLRLRGQTEIGSTFFKVIGKYASDLRGRGGVLLIAGVESAVLERMGRAGQLNMIGADHIFLAGSVIGESTADAIRAGEAWLAALPDVLPATVNEAAFKEAANDTVEKAMAPTGEKPRVQDAIQQMFQRSMSVPMSRLSYATLSSGLIILSLGVAAVLFPNAMEQLLLPLIGALLLLVAMSWIYAGFVESETAPPQAPHLRMVSAGVATMTGASLIVQPFFDVIGLSTARVLLAVGLALLGMIGLVLTYRDVSDARVRIADVTANIALIVLAVLTITSLERGSSPIVFLGWLAIGAGGSLVVYAFVRRYLPSPVATGDAGER